MSDQKSISIVFLGSGPVAAESLRLIQETFIVEAVITKPTTEKEMRGVLASDIPVSTVSTKNELDELIVVSKFESQLAVLVDFGIIVSQKTISSFPKGIVNSHFSLLPDLRGADPISFAILEGKETTGVSLMLLVEAMDEGPLLAQSELPIEAEDTTPSLTEKLIGLSNAMLKEILPGWVDGSITSVEQSNATGATYTRKLTKSDGAIDWRKDSGQIEREVRAFAGWPKSRTQLGDIDCVITAAKSDDFKGGKASDIVINGKSLQIVCGAGSLEILRLKPAGKKEMTAEAFLAGYKNRL